MNIFRDKQIKHFSLFIAIYSILLVGVSTWFSINQLNTAKSMYLEHDRAIVSALLEQEVSKEVIANAISSTDISTAGMEFLDNLGITTNTFGSLLPHFSQFQYHFLRIALGGGICLVIILVIGVISFLQTVKETIGVGVNEKAALSSDKNCPFVYINFDFTLVNKVASL